MFDKKFIKNYDENSGKKQILEVDAEYHKKLYKLHDDLPFLPEKIKIEKCHELVCNLYDKKKYVAHIKISTKLQINTKEDTLGKSNQSKRMFKILY